MSKKKNTLKDLDEFLKQQAATLVSPTPLSDPTREHIEDHDSQHSSTRITRETILDHLNALSLKEGEKFRLSLYDLIIQSLEFRQHTTAEDKMLINTVLYLQSGSEWKAVIKKYWETHS